MGLIIQYQCPLAFPCKAVLDGGLGVDISGMDVLNADVPLLNGVGSVDNARVGNLRINRQKVFKSSIGGEAPKLLRQTSFDSVRRTQDQYLIHGALGKHDAGNAIHHIAFTRCRCMIQGAGEFIRQL